MARRSGLLAREAGGLITLVTTRSPNSFEDQLLQYNQFETSGGSVEKSGRLSPGHSGACKNGSTSQNAPEANSHPSKSPLPDWNLQDWLLRGGEGANPAHSQQSNATLTNENLSRLISACFSSLLQAVSESTPESRAVAGQRGTISGAGGHRGAL